MFLNSSCFTAPCNSCPGTKGTSFREPSAQILQFQADMCFPVFSILSEGMMMVSPNFGSLQGCSAAPRHAGSLPAHTLIFQVPVQLGGESPQKPASPNSPCLRIQSSQPYRLPCGELGTYGFRQPLRLRGNRLSFHRGLKQTACFSPSQQH